MMPDRRLEEILLTFRDLDIPDGPPPEVVSRTLAGLRREPPKTLFFFLPERIRTMPLFFRIAAAVVVSTGILSVLTSDRKGPGVALADVLEHVRAARTMTYTMRIGDAPDVFRVSRMEPGL